MSRSSIIALCVAITAFVLIAGGIKWKEHLDHEKRVDGWTQVLERCPDCIGD